MGLIALQHVGSSRTRARTHVVCISRQILNYCGTREAPMPLFSMPIRPQLGGLFSLVLSLKNPR